MQARRGREGENLPKDEWRGQDEGQLINAPYFTKVIQVLTFKAFHLRSEPEGFTAPPSFLRVCKAYVVGLP